MSALEVGSPSLYLYVPNLADENMLRKISSHTTQLHLCLPKYTFTLTSHIDILIPCPQTFYPPLTLVFLSFDLLTLWPSVHRNKECPTCRKKLVSKRSLRPDPNFDALISKIYPSRDEYEAHQERVLARISKHNNQQALSHSIEEGLKIQAMNRSLTHICFKKKKTKRKENLKPPVCTVCVCVCYICGKKYFVQLLTT